MKAGNSQPGAEALPPAEDEDEDGIKDPAQVFESSGLVFRHTYRREWYGPDFLIRCGKFKGQLLSEVKREKWLVWALTRFEDKLTQSLRRALIDQLNSLHT